MTEVPLGEALELVIDHRGKTPKKLGGDFTESGVPVVSAIHIKDGIIQWSERERYVSPQMFARWMPERLQKGDVLLTSEAPLGQTALVPSDHDLVLSQRLFALRGKEGVLDSAYLRYFLASDVGQRRLHDRATGTTVVGIRQSELMKVLIPLPPLDDQRRISGVLGSLDDLIEVNRGLIANLVSLGDLAFDNWAAGVKARIALGEVMVKVADGVESGSIAVDEVYLGLEHFGLDAAGLIGRGTADGLASNKIRFNRGDVLYGKLRPYFRKVARPGFPGVCTTEAWVLRGAGPATQEYIHWIARRSTFTQRAMAGSEGTKMPRANWSHVTAMSVPDPAAPGLLDVSRSVGELWEAANALEQENSELASTRDELLPLLISGRVRVGDVAA